MRPRISGSYKDGVPYARVSGAYKKAAQAWVKVNGVWKKFYQELKVSVSGSYTTTVDAYEYTRTVNLLLDGTYKTNATVSVVKVSGSSSVNASRISDTQWKFWSAGTSGTVTATFRFIYKNALETSTVDYSVTVYKVAPPPPPPPPPSTTPPSTGGTYNGVIVNYPTLVKSDQTWTWSISNGTPNSTWYATGCDWKAGGRIPASGSFSLDASGAASYSDGRINKCGPHTVTWHFSDGQIVTKYVVVPYYIVDWMLEFGLSSINTTLLNAIINLYRCNVYLADLPNGRPGYGLYRNPDAGGLYYWYNQSFSRYGGSVTSAMKKQFVADAFNNHGIDNTRVTTTSKGWLSGNKYGGDIYDRY